MDTNNKYFLAGAVILAVLFIGWAVMWGASHPAQPSSQTESQKVVVDGDPYLGSADAPLTIAFWSDYQCTFCKAVEVGGIPQITTPPALPEIIKNYVDTGKVRIVFMDFAFLGNDSITGALYGRAIWDLYPDKYFEWRTAMFNAQDEEGDRGFGNAASIDALNATISGIDAAKVAADVKANASAYQAMIDADKAEGQKFGVQATPSFLIGTKVVAGAYPYATFQEAIDALLK